MKKMLETVVYWCAMALVVALVIAVMAFLAKVDHDVCMAKHPGAESWACWVKPGR